MTINLNSLNKSYGKKPVLFDINLEIPTGSFTMLKGVSGSGKSTLLSIIGGIEPMTSGQLPAPNLNTVLRFCLFETGVEL